MKNQVIRINKKVYDRMGNEYSSCVIPVIHRMKPKQQMQQQGLQMDSLQAVMYGSDFVVQVRAFPTLADMGTRKNFEVFPDDSGNTAVWEVLLTLP